MKKQSGITLMTLTLYIMIMMIVIGIMTVVVNNFYQNTDAISADTEELMEFNKFNAYFLREIKQEGNKVDEIKDNYILFSSGNSFSIENERIYYNNIEICKGVKQLVFKLGQNGNGQIDSIICVNLVFQKFNKTLNYKVEEIY